MHMHELHEQAALFSSENFMPHGHCYLWTPGLLWTQVVTNALIGIAYIAITINLALLVRRVKDIPFKAMYFAFGVFIVTCGFTHFMDVYVIWHPEYWWDGLLRAVTAIASVGTALLLPPLVPKAVALARGAQAIHARGLELEHVVRDLEAMYEKTRELEALKTQFFANLSHELRTPIALILGPAERLRDGADLTEAQRADLDVILRNGRTLLGQVDQLLDVARLEAGRVEARYEHLDLAGLTRLAAAHFESVAAEANLALVVDAPAALVAVTDPAKVQRILLNLLSNAFKFTPAGGRVRVTLAESPRGEDGRRQARLEVADSGPGIPESFRPVVFERFRQLEGGSTRRFGGTGLGLAIVKELAEVVGGSVRVDTAPEGGALFVVDLPLEAPADASIEKSAAELSPAAARAAGDTRDALTARGEAAAVDAKVADEVPSEGPATRPEERGVPLVLVVEDNPDLRRFLAETLREGFEVVTARDGRDGLDKAHELRPDVVVTDLMMPVLSGDQLVAELRRAPLLADTPVLVLSAKTDDVLKTELLASLVEDYVSKPVAASELRARVGNLARMGRSRSLLQGELDSRTRDLDELVREVVAQRRRLADALDAALIATQQAEAASQTKSRLLALVSHELRTPLTSIGLQTERLRRRKEDPLTPGQLEIVGRIEAAAQRQTELVEALIDRVRLESGTLDLSAEPLDAAALAREVALGLDEVARRKGLTLTVDAPADLPPLVGDRRALGLVLTSLVDNALKFTDQGSVTVTLSAGPEGHRIAVRDTGPGIPTEQQARLFRPFETLEVTDKKHLHGVGLGLALVSDLVTAMGGRVTLESAPGTGSVFTVELPPPTWV